MSNYQQRHQVFRVDQMYYFTAMELIKDAKVIQKEVDHIESDLREVEACQRAAESEAQKAILEDAIDNYALGLFSTYPALLPKLATAQILLAASAEAHINHAAKHLLSGGHFDHFERLKADGKWLFLPRLLGVRGFDTGKNPFQDFQRLVRFRNELIHYRSRREPVGAIGRSGMPTYLEKIGLTFLWVEKSAVAVRGMFAELRNQVKDPYTTSFWEFEAAPWTFLRTIGSDGSDEFDESDMPF